MRRVYKNFCPAMISVSIMAANMWKNGVKNVESDNNKILYETLLVLVLQRNGTYCLNTPRTLIRNTTECPTPKLPYYCTNCRDFAKLFLYKPGDALKTPGGYGSKISRQSKQEYGKAVSPMQQPS